MPFDVVAAAAAMVAVVVAVETVLFDLAVYSWARSTTAARFWRAESMRSVWSSDYVCRYKNLLKACFFSEIFYLRGSRKVLQRNRISNFFFF